MAVEIKNDCGMTRWIDEVRIKVGLLSCGDGNVDLYTSIHNDVDVRNRMDKISMPVCSRKCGFSSKITLLQVNNRRPLPRIMLFQSLRMVE